MLQKLYSGDHFPQLTFNLAGGGTYCIPKDIDSKYLIAGFYRGHW